MTTQVQILGMLRTVQDQADIVRFMEARTHIPVEKPPAEDHKIMDQRIRAREAILIARAAKETNRGMDLHTEARVTIRILPMLVGIHDIIGRGIIIEEDEFIEKSPNKRGKSIGFGQRVDAS